MEMSKQPSQPMQEEEKEEIVMDTTITEEIAATDLNHHSKSIRLELEKRIKKAKMTQQKDMVKADRLEFDNPQNVSEFSQNIYLNMLKSEQDHLIIPHDYLTTVQTEIRDTQRAFLLEWIIDVHRKFKLKSETLYAAQYIIDKFLSKHKIKNTQLHLLGISTILLATKYEEIYPPELRDLLAVSENKFTRD